MEQSVGDNHNAPSGCFFTAFAAVQFERLSGDAGGLKPVVLLVLVHEPGHHLAIGPHIRCGNIGIGSHHIVDLIHKLTSQSLELPLAQAAGVDGNPPFGPPVGKIHHGGFPGHQLSQRLHFFIIHFGVISQSPFHGATGTVMLNTVTDKGPNLAIIQPDGQLKLLSVRIRQNSTRADSLSTHLLNFRCCRTDLGEGLLILLKRGRIPRSSDPFMQKPCGQFSQPQMSGGGPAGCKPQKIQLSITT